VLCWTVVVSRGRLACWRTQLRPFPWETARVVPDAEPVRGERDSPGLVLPLAQVFISPLWWGDCSHWGLSTSQTPSFDECRMLSMPIAEVGEENGIIWNSVEVLEFHRHDEPQFCLLFVDINMLNLRHCDTVAFTPYAGVNTSTMEFRQRSVARHWRQVLDSQQSTSQLLLRFILLHQPVVSTCKVLGPTEVTQRVLYLQGSNHSVIKT